MLQTALYRTEHFNAAHRLFCGEWDEHKNKEVFGKCFSPNFHGHNYKLTVGLKGIPDEKTGYLADTKWLSALIQRQIIEYMDHRNLNLDVEEFSKINPTVENIARVIYERLRPFIDTQIDLKIELYETERNRAEYPATW